MDRAFEEKSMPSKSKVKPIPDGFHTVTPYLICKDAAACIEFYKKAFGAEERFRMPGPDGKSVMHAELKIGDSIIMLSNEWPDWQCLSPVAYKGTPVSMCLYVKDCDAAFKRAVDAGANVVRPLQDQFYGDRSGTVADPSGHVWTIATHKEDLTPEEIGRRQKEFFAKAPKKK
jgi:uncharacterized glyoxalase superfamily protein PhnB